MAISKNRRRPIDLGENRDNRGDITLRRTGACFIIPVSCQTKDGRVNKAIAKLIRNATKESITKLEELGVTCCLEEVSEVGTEKSFA